MSRQNVQDVTKLSKTEIVSELNALWYLDNWTPEDYQYRDALEAEYHRLVEEGCKISTISTKEG